MVTSCAGGHGDLLVEDAGFVEMGGILLLHAHRTATSPDIAGKAQKLFHMNHFHAFVTGGLCCFFQIQLAAYGDTEHMDAVLRPPCHQCLEDLLRRHTDGLGSVHSVQIVLVVFIEAFPAGDACFFHKSNCVGFVSHKITASIIRQNLPSDKRKIIGSTKCICKIVR